MSAVVSDDWALASRDCLDGAMERMGLADHVRELLCSTAREPAGADPSAHGRRQPPHLHRLPHPALQRARALQRRRALPPGRQPRRVASAGVAHDLEDRALVGVPFGPAKGSVDCAPQELSPAELEQVARTWLNRVEIVLGPERDIPAPDVGGGPQMMNWTMDEWGRINGFSPAIVTGKPTVLYGSAGREDATGRGVALSLHDARGARRSIRPAPAWSSRASATSAPGPRSSSPRPSGWRVIGVANVDGAIHREAGIDPRRLRSLLDEGPRITDMLGADVIEADDLLCLDCDALVPAALASAGGVIVSYLEWVQNRQHLQWEESDMNRRLTMSMGDAFQAVTARAGRRDIRLRDAAYQIAVERVIAAAAAGGYLDSRDVPADARR